METPTIESHSSSASEQDRQHLHLLGIFYYVWGGLVALCGCAGAFYIVIGIIFATSPAADLGPDDPPAGLLGGLMIGMGACMMIVLFGLAALYVATGHLIQQHRNRIFCMVMAGIACLSIPLGTILGVFTLVVLMRPSVIELFEQKRIAT